MKYYIRRAVVGTLAIPFIAGAWCFVYLALIILGGEPTQTIDETFSNGLLIGVVLDLAFIFSPQLTRFLDRVTGAPLHEQPPF